MFFVLCKLDDYSDEDITRSVMATLARSHFPSIAHTQTEFKKENSGLLFACRRGLSRSSCPFTRDSHEQGLHISVQAVLRALQRERALCSECAHKLMTEALQPGSPIEGRRRKEEGLGVRGWGLEKDRVASSTFSLASSPSSLVPPLPSSPGTYTARVVTTPRCLLGLMPASRRR